MNSYAIQSDLKSIIDFPFPKSNFCDLVGMSCEEEFSILPSPTLDPHRPDCHRRPLPPPPQPQPQPDWGGLHCDILALILKGLKQIEEFVVFGSVCKSWRIVARDNKRCLPPQIPCLMLPDDNNPENKYHRQIYSLSKEEILAKNLYIPELYDKRCIGLNYGWVLTVSRLGGEMNLVHPILGLQIELPPHTSIYGYKKKATYPSCTFFHKVALRGNPSESSDYVVMVLHATGDYVYCWKPGYGYWNLVTDWLYCIKDLTCYQDQFYAVTVDGCVLVLNVDHEGSVIPHEIGRVLPKGLAYIVGSTRGLLVVSRYIRSEEEGGEGFRGVAPRTHLSRGLEEIPDEKMEWEGWRYRSVRFRVLELDLIKGGYKRTTDLGDRAIFVGYNTSICFDCNSELSGIKSNHIYFTDDNFEEYMYLFKGGGRDMGIYNLKDGRITQFKIDESSHRSRISPPFWFIPSL